MNSISLVPLATELHSRDQAGRPGDANPFSPPFIQGSGKSLWDVLCNAVAEHKTGYSPIVLYGSSGTGKTPLIGRLADYFRVHHPTSKTVCTSGDEFAREFASAVELDSLSDFRRKYRAADFWALDGLEQLANKTAAQLELLHSLDALLTKARWVVVTARSAPVLIRCLHGGLRSRLSGGLTIPLAPSCLGRPTKTTPMASSVTGSEPDKKANIREITKRVARYFHLKQTELTGSSRRQGIVHARNVAIYLSRKITGTSYEELGRQFGGRDHTTVLHGFQRIVSSLESDEETRQAVRELAEQLSAD